MKIINFHLDTELTDEELKDVLLGRFPDAKNVSISEDASAEVSISSGNWFPDHPAFKEGYSDGFCAMGPKENPYEYGSKYYEMWEYGYGVGQEET